jgi:PBP1b-binding outer membrane lipoprotein LpoB
MKRIILLYFITLMLSGCAATPEKTVEVKIPVPAYTPCPVEIPTKPEKCIPKDATRPEALRCMLVERERIKAYSLELEAQLRVCSE